MSRHGGSSRSISKADVVFGGRARAISRRGRRTLIAGWHDRARGTWTGRSPVVRGPQDFAAGAVSSWGVARSGRLVWAPPWAQVAAIVKAAHGGRAVVRATSASLPRPPCPAGSARAFLRRRRTLRGGEHGRHTDDPASNRRTHARARTRRCGQGRDRALRPLQPCRDARQHPWRAPRRPTRHSSRLGYGVTCFAVAYAAFAFAS